MIVPSPQLGGIVFDTEKSFYFLTIVVVIIMTLLAKNLARAKVGRAFIAVRDNDIAAEVMGVNLFAYKLLAFAICSFFAGIAGSLWAHYITFITPEHFSLMDSIWYLGMVIVGGLGSTLGAILGTVFVKLLDTLVRVVGASIGTLVAVGAAQFLSAAGPIIFGLVIIFFLIFEPR
ncbi:MAG: branched-chain amino acid ABC transporter permease, partial [Chloroflexi bacterium CG07_land_8_20_14_0_80_51_10]